MGKGRGKSKNEWKINEKSYAVVFSGGEVGIAERSGRWVGVHSFFLFLPIRADIAAAMPVPDPPPASGGGLHPVAVPLALGPFPGIFFSVRKGHCSLAVGFPL